MKLPALFVGHGNPMNALDDNNVFNQGFEQITKTFEKPKLILCISAHWYSSSLQVSSGENPEMIYDFHGFPDELSEIVYPAKGSPEFAKSLQKLLEPEKVELNATRGFDHGAWAVLKYLYPDADIPVVQLSLDRTKPAEWHYALAKKLRPLREQGVLILGSGDIVHNLRAISWEHMDQIGAGYDWAYQFRDAINGAIAENDVDTLVHFEQLGESAELSVPTPDHYLPLLYVMAQRDEADQITLFNDKLVAGSISMTSVLVKS
ncbi:MULTISPECIES: 4,5-DOPA dioxygenase extradiol [Glaesserella]|uniref:4,5-DOPA dioxygenase extradiol n=1 Tax=Glaesserella australis TaxID=2094024 RepID=A0A328BYZ6_9PAST|nr:MULTISPECIES: 4,5-DOPA dioxygenase extradiol [Glaesserella]AUI66930.1 4,5-DOPA dioxygenase extradiol [Glaesserella sp. 15-184]RAL19506.1 4,5-DOPA dioxygenase extradiol [Glaesserella australis]